MDWPGAGVAVVGVTESHPTSDADEPQSSKPGSVSLSTVAVKLPTIHRPCRRRSHRRRGSERCWSWAGRTTLSRPGRRRTARLVIDRALDAAVHDERAVGTGSAARPGVDRERRRSATRCRRPGRRRSSLGAAPRRRCHRCSRPCRRSHHTTRTPRRTGSRPAAPRCRVAGSYAATSFDIGVQRTGRAAADDVELAVGHGLAGCRQRHRSVRGRRPGVSGRVVDPRARGSDPAAAQPPVTTTLPPTAPAATALRAPGSACLLRPGQGRRVVGVDTSRWTPMPLPPAIEYAMPSTYTARLSITVARVVGDVGPWRFLRPGVATLHQATCPDVPVRGRSRSAP